MARSCRHGGVGFADFLQRFIEEELAARAIAATARRLRDRAFPFATTIEQSGTLWVSRSGPTSSARWCCATSFPPSSSGRGHSRSSGNLGLGKTMLAVCVATKQVQLGYAARFLTAQALAGQLGQVNTARARQRLLGPLLSCDVLVLDELGYLPTEASFGPTLYEVIAGRYERRPTIFTNNNSVTE